MTPGQLVRQNRQLRKLGEYLVHLPSCHACDVEHQPCEVRVAHDIGAEICICSVLFLLTRNDQYLREIAQRLKRYAMCHACTIEGQEHDCVVIEMRWAGRELLRILDRPGWITHKLTTQSATPPRHPAS